MTTENEKSLHEDTGKLEILKEGRNFDQIQLSNYEKAADCITDKDVKRISYQDYLGFEIVKCFESGLETVRIWNKQDPEISIVLPFSVFDNRKVMLVIRNLGYVDAACYLDLKRAIDERQKSDKVTWIHKQVGFASYHGKVVFKYMGGRVPYGFRLKEGAINGKRTKTYIPYEEEADQIRLMYDLYSESNTSYGDIVVYFQAHGITCRGKPWERARIADHLKNPIYVQADLDVYEFFQQQGTVIESPQEDFVGTNGCYYYKGRDTNNRKLADLKDNRLVLAPHEGFIPSETWLKCRTKCLQNKQIQPARKVVNTWLAGLVKCGNCHYALTFKKYNTRRSRYLLCSHKLNSKACEGAGTIYADEFETMIYQEMVKKLEEFPVLAKNDEPVQENPKAAALRIELNKVKQEIESLMDKVALANATLMEFINRRIEKLAAKQEKLEQELAGYALNHVDDSQLNQIQGYLSKWESITLDDKRKVADCLIEVIYATSEKVDIHWKI